MAYGFKCDLNIQVFLLKQSGETLVKNSQCVLWSRVTFLETNMPYQFREDRMHDFEVMAIDLSANQVAVAKLDMCRLTHKTH